LPLKCKSISSER